MPSSRGSRLWRWNMTFSLHALLSQPPRASLQLGTVDWLGSWADVSIAVFILFRRWGMPPDVARLTENVRETRQMTASLFFRAIQGDLSPDDRSWPVIYLLTALMWGKWEGRGNRGWQKTRRKWRATGGKIDRPFVPSQYQQPFCPSQWTLGLVWDPWLAAFRARNQIYTAELSPFNLLAGGKTTVTLY